MKLLLKNEGQELFDKIELYPMQSLQLRHQKTLVYLYVLVFEVFSKNFKGKGFLASWFSFKQHKEVIGRGTGCSLHPLTV